MIEKTFKEVHSNAWLKHHGLHETHELFILRQVIPWSEIMLHLSSYYCEKSGRFGVCLRTLIAVLLLGKLRKIGDQAVIDLVQENRYAQYFCNVEDSRLHFFLERSSLVKFRKRIGVKGCQKIEWLLFERLRHCGVIVNDVSLIDSSVLLNHLLYPNDVDLLYRAFEKMKKWAKFRKVELWWNDAYLKKRWRVYNVGKKKQRLEFLLEFHSLFTKASKMFEKRVRRFQDSTDKTKGKHWVEVFRTLKKQTRQKLKGETQISNRLVSLEELDARPIKKGKSFPDCEFGTTNQMSFNRQGFMVTSEILQGNPSDKSLYLSTLDTYRLKMKGLPKGSITDLGYRAKANFKAGESLQYTCFGKMEDVEEEKREFCKSARSATEGFIAVAKNWRGMDKSHYRGLLGDQCWAALTQASYNLKKFSQLYQQEMLAEQTLQKLGFIT